MNIDDMLVWIAASPARRGGEPAPPVTSSRKRDDGREAPSRRVVPVHGAEATEVPRGPNVPRPVRAA